MARQSGAAMHPELFVAVAVGDAAATKGVNDCFTLKRTSQQDC